jgi:hypothetical protein
MPELDKHHPHVMCKPVRELFHTLHDGREVSTNSHDWKLECLARFLLKLPMAKRREWLNGWPAHIERELMMRMYAIADAQAVARRR